MLECWDEDPNNRPTFERLHETITGFLKEEVNISILSFLFFFTCQHPFIDKTMVVNTPAEPKARVLVLG